MHFFVFGLEADGASGAAEVDGLIHEYSVDPDGNFCGFAADAHGVPIAGWIFRAFYFFLPAAAFWLSARHGEFFPDAPEIPRIASAELDFDGFRPSEQFLGLRGVDEDPAVAGLSTRCPAPFDGEFVVGKFLVGAHQSGRAAFADQNSIGNGPDRLCIHLGVDRLKRPTGQILAVEKCLGFSSAKNG